MSKEITFYTDIPDFIAGLLVEQFKEKTNFVNFVKSLSQEAQTLENVFKDLYLDRSIDSGIGEQLDNLGEILGLNRNGQTDDVYRINLKFQAVLNASKGEPEILISALKIFTDSTIVYFYELFPAKCYGYFNNDTFIIPPDFNSKMDNICGGGIKWLGSIIGNHQPFIFDILYYIEGNPDQFGGFAAVDVSNVLVDDGTCGLFTFFV
jgi:hypothetical protein